jgi:hypothetical protein
MSSILYFDVARGSKQFVAKVSAVSLKARKLIPPACDGARNIIVYYVSAVLEVTLTLCSFTFRRIEISTIRLIAMPFKHLNCFWILMNCEIRFYGAI